ncbi:MAG: glycosyltransferase, partial [Bacilli bacterium]|nr:glycosyltransferase [Bacilli bacterium]
MKNFGKVSIIIPVYNAENYIDECLDSCINQTYKNIEIICVNDGSSDASLEHIEKYMKTYKNIVLINQENSGVAVARNVGIDASTGDYVMFVDSDDYIDANMVFIMISELVKANMDAVKCNVDTTLAFFQHSKIKNNRVYRDAEYQDIIIKQLFEDNNIFCTACNAIYKRELCGVFPKGFRYGEDVLFNGEYFLKAKSVALIKDALYHYRNNPTSVTHKPNIDTTINNLEHFNSYYYVSGLVKDMNNVKLKE